MNISEKFANIMYLQKKKSYTNLSRVSGEVFLVAENDKVSPTKLQFLSCIS